MSRITEHLSSYANARLAESEGRVKDAIYFYKKAIYTNQARDLAVPGYAMLLQKLGNVDRAIQVLEKVGHNKHKKLLCILTQSRTGATVSFTPGASTRTLLMEMTGVENFVISPYTLGMLVPNVQAVVTVEYPNLAVVIDDVTSSVPDAAEALASGHPIAKNRAVVEFRSINAARKALTAKKMQGFRVAPAPGYTADEVLNTIRSHEDWEKAFQKPQTPFSS